MVIAIIVIIIFVAIVAAMFACCKISGECSRDEENRIDK